MANQRPTATLRDGRLKATIWKNRGKERDYYAVRFTRTYTDAKGAFRDTDRFSASELLQLALLATRAYEELARLSANDRAAADQASPDDGRVA